MSSVSVEGRVSLVDVEEHTDGKHPNSAIMEHTSTNDHRYTMDDITILVRENKWFSRKIGSPPHPQEIPCPQPRPMPRDTPIILQLLSRDPRVM